MNNIENVVIFIMSLGMFIYLLVTLILEIKEKFEE